MSKVTFTESLIDTGMFVGIDSYEKKTIDVDNAIKWGVVSFGEGMLMRDWIRNKMEPLQTEPIIKNIAASSVSKMAGITAYNFLAGSAINFEIVKKSVFAGAGTGVIKYWFNL